MSYFTSYFMTNIATIQDHVLGKLKAGLPASLTYHNVGHTLDVLTRAQAIAREEGITGEEDLYLLSVSALYHDVGFTFVYGGHEEKSCSVARAELPSFGLNPDQIERVCAMIMATRIPQSPATLFEMILCDADLDYLGRPDFYSIGNTLYSEFLHQGIVHDEQEWNRLQVRFLEGHHYFTQSSRKQREPVKQQHLEEVRRKVAVTS